MQDSKRRYKCLECGNKTTSFLYDCPGCGESEYKNLMSEAEKRESEGMDPATETYVRYTSAFNPYAPA